MPDSKYAAAPALTLLKNMLIALVSLILIGALAAAIAIPLSRRNDSIPSSNSVSAALAPTPDPTPSLPSCTYNASTPVVTIDPRIPPWPYADNKTWVEDADGISFWPEKTNSKFIQPVHASHPRAYPFTVSDAGHYLFLMLLSSEHVSDFNDVWMRFDHGNGVQLWNPEKGLNVAPPNRGWLKWFSNDGPVERHLGGHALEYDNHHFIATAEELVPGEVYTLELAGRSSRLKIHRLFAVKCLEETCANTGFTKRLALKAEADDKVTECVR